MPISSNDLKVNEQIRAPQVRLIGANGDQLGVLPLREALRVAREYGLDLVEVAPQAEPPVCRVQDYGKLRYEQAKKAREGHKASKSSEVREIRFRPNIGQHDLDAKVRKAKELLTEDGDKVKVSVFFRGREMSHPDLGMQLLRKIAETLKEDAKLEKPPMMEGRAITMVLVPANPKFAPAVQTTEAQ